MNDPNTTTVVQRSVLQRSAIVLAVFWQIGATFLPALGFGEQIGSRSDEVRTLVTPAGYAFSIWGLLFLGSVVFAVWQALPNQHDNRLLDRIGWPAAGAFAGNGLWATYTTMADLTFVSAIIILATLACLLAALRRLVAWPRFSAAERWIAALLLSALAAWLTAASIVNIAASLTYHGFGTGIGGGGEQPVLAGGIVLVGGIVAALAVWRSRGNPWYALVFGWALLAIWNQGGQRAVEVAGAAAISAVLVAIAMITGLRPRENRAHWLGRLGGVRR